MYNKLSMKLEHACLYYTVTVTTYIYHTNRAQITVKPLTIKDGMGEGIYEHNEDNNSSV